METQQQLKEGEINNPGFAVLQDVLNRQQATRGTRHIVFADINKTMEHQVGFPTAEYIDNRPLYDVINSYSLGLVNITSRSLREVVEYIRAGIILPPHALATNNGTLLYSLQRSSARKNPDSITEADFSLDEAYNQKVVTTGFDKKTLLAEIPNRLFSPVQDRFPGTVIDLQIEDRGENWKTWGLLEHPYQLVSDVELIDGQNRPDELLTLARDIYTGYELFLMHNAINPDSGAHRYGLFVLPKGFGKHQPIAHILSAVSATGGIFAGDSENDAAAFFGDYGEHEPHFARVAVGGSSARLRSQIDNLVEERRRSPWRRLGLNGRIVPFYDEPSSLRGPESLQKAIEQALKLDAKTRQATTSFEQGGE